MDYTVFKFVSVYESVEWWHSRSSKKRTQKMLGRKYKKTENIKNKSEILKDRKYMASVPLMDHSL